MFGCATSTPTSFTGNQHAPTNATSISGTGGTPQDGQASAFVTYGTRSPNPAGTYANTVTTQSTLTSAYVDTGPTKTSSFQPDSTTSPILKPSKNIVKTIQLNSGEAHELHFRSATTNREIRYFWTIPRILEEFVEPLWNFTLPTLIFKSHKFPKDKQDWQLILTSENNITRDCLTQNDSVDTELSLSVHKDGGPAKGNYVIEIRNRAGSGVIRHQGFSTNLHQMQFNLTDSLFANKNDMLINGNLSVYCSLTEMQAMKYDNLLTKLHHGCQMTDMECITGSYRHKCHKAVLASASPVFEKMFATNSSKKNHDVVDFSGILDEDTLKDMLAFIYTERAPNIETTCKTLLAAACKHDLDDLKVHCQLHVAQNCLKLENVMEYLELAVNSGATWLKELCIGMVMNNFKDLRESEAWKKASNHVKESVFC